MKSKVLQSLRIFAFCDRLLICSDVSFTIIYCIFNQHPSYLKKNLLVVLLIFSYAAFLTKSV